MIRSANRNSSSDHYGNYILTKKMVDNEGYINGFCVIYFDSGRGWGLSLKERNQPIILTRSSVFLNPGKLILVPGA